MRKKKCGKRRSLVSRIFRRLNKTVPKKDIKAIQFLICEELIKSFKNNESVSIKGFGTFSPHDVTPKLFHNVTTGEFELCSLTKNISFHLHSDFVRLFKHQKQKFSKKS